ncbi:HEAT repeat domain-containing protein [Caldinitratiruptor microaerophilus]|uniref:HEAT repeat domain-containing protein n=1 Tax=Caldinitratiruptor microaerophilus TaxID=671077 RepID=UPI00223212EB|nr:HEAT repeat domain-containing protein [Caldinitratiruptor microaerophilus]
MELQYLLEQARSGDVGIRRTAMRQLARYPVPEALTALVAGLCDEPAVADAAAHSLLRIGGEAAARAVVPLLAHEEVRPRSVALDVLIGLGRTAGPVLVELLGHPDRELRKMAAEVLAQGTYVEACPALEAVLDDPDPVVRAAAAAAVAALGCRGAAQHLVQRLAEEREDWVRFALAGAVARLASPNEVQALLEEMPDGALADLVRTELRHRLEGAAVEEEAWG